MLTFGRKKRHQLKILALVDVQWLQEEFILLFLMTMFSAADNYIFLQDINLKIPL